jgi:hypothetical protein
MMERLKDTPPDHRASVRKITGSKNSGFASEGRVRYAGGKAVSSRSKWPIDSARVIATPPKNHGKPPESFRGWVGSANGADLYANPLVPESNWDRARLR